MADMSDREAIAIIDNLLIVRRSFKPEVREALAEAISALEYRADLNGEAEPEFYITDVLPGQIVGTEDEVMDRELEQGK